MVIKYNYMAKIALISCCKTKVPVKDPDTIEAKSLYQSPLFKKSLRYAKEKIEADRIFILSAGYGLLNLDDQISEYNTTLNGQSTSAIKSWSSGVRQQLMKEGVDFKNDEIFILAGKNYYKFLITDEFANVRYPYQNMRIGKILHFLNEQF